MRARTGLAAIVLGGTAAAQAPLYDLSGQPGNQLSQCVAGLGDLDGDGRGDFALGAPFGDGLQPGAGYVNIYSGRTGGLLLQVLGEETGDRFGWSVAALGDIDGDAVPDFIVGAPTAEFTTGTDRGMVHLFSGADGHELWWYGGVVDAGWLGWSVAGVGDVNGDGVPDFAMGEPGLDVGPFPELGRVSVDSGATFGSIQTFYGEADGDYFGWSIAPLGDVSGDGVPDFAVGAPYFDNGGSTPLGRAYLVKITQPPSPRVTLATGSFVGSHMGHAVGGGFDYNGDGVGDIALGEPYFQVGGVPCGRVRIHSGATLAQVNLITGTGDDLLGYSVAGLADANGDGRGDLIIGAPGGDIGANLDFGFARVYSGPSWAPLYDLNGYHNGERMGHSVASAGLLNADGWTDMVAGANASDLHGTDCGRARIVLGNAPLPSTYCTPKVNSIGCTPLIFFTGCPSTSAGDNFRIHAMAVIVGKVGLLLWSPTAAATPFFGGTLCLGAPVRRTPGQIAFTYPSGQNCTGGYEFHFSQAYMASQGVVAGQLVHAQYWSRDQGYAPPNNVGLTNALRTTILP